MDVPTLLPEPAHVTPATPAPVPVHTSRSAQVALGVFLALMLGLLVFRGYWSSLGAKPLERALTALVDLNHADRAELEQVPGIGPSLAKEIADDRQKRGRFKSVEELRRVKGVGPATLDKVRPFLSIEATAFPPQPDATPEPLVLERKPPAAAPYPRAGGSAKKLQAGDAPINVNTASAEELTRLPGIGPVTAQHIVTARADKPFKSLADIDRAKGVGPKTLEKIRPFIVLE